MNTSHTKKWTDSLDLKFGNNYDYLQEVIYDLN